MIALGFTARVRKWITPEQKDGAKSLVFGILFPILIFNAIFTSQLSPSTAMIILYVTLAFVGIYFIGKLTVRVTGEEYGHLTPFLLTSCEGGNAALPLYTTIVGSAYAINTVTFDMACVIIVFILIPTLVTARTSGNMDLKQLLKKTVTNSFVVAAGGGLILNVLGVYQAIQGTQILELYNTAASAAIAPVGGIILFTIGYDLNADASMIGPIIKLALMRVFTGCLIIAGFFLLFPQLMSETVYKIAVFLYFMCPPGFVMPTQLSPLCKEKREEYFMSSFISMFMIITLCVYIVLVMMYR